MAKDKKVYEGVPAGAVFEASQKALRALNLEIDAEDIGQRQIFAERKKTFWDEAVEITLSMSEVGQATELRISTEPEAFFDNIGSKDLISKVLKQVNKELEKIRSDGRIPETVSPKKYQFGQPNSSTDFVAAPPSSSPQKLRKKEASDKKKASGGIGLGVPVLIGLWWLFTTESGEEFRASLLNSIPAEVEISGYDCDRLARYFEGRSVQNMFGAQSRVLEITNVSQIVRSDERVRCNATATLSNGRTQRVRLQVYRSDGGRMLFEISSL